MPAVFGFEALPLQAFLSGHLIPLELRVHQKRPLKSEFQRVLQKPQGRNSIWQPRLSTLSESCEFHYLIPCLVPLKSWTGIAVSRLTWRHVFIFCFQTRTVLFIIWCWLEKHNNLVFWLITKPQSTQTRRYSWALNSEVNSMPSMFLCAPYDWRYWVCWISTVLWYQ